MLAVILGLCAASPAVARTIVDRHVDAMTAHHLLATPPRLLVDSNRQREAEALAGYTRPLFLMRAFAEILALFFFWQTGVAARWRDVLRRYFRFAIPVRFTFGVTMAAVALAAGYPFAFWGQRIARLAQLSSERLSAWSAAYFAQGVLIAVGVGCVVVVVLALVASFRQWYVVVALGVVVFTLSYASAVPMLENAVDPPTPLHVSPALERRLATLKRRAGVPSLPIVRERTTDGTNEANAHIEGIGPDRRIVLDQSELATATDPEIGFAVAHELGHVARGDDVRIALALALLVIFSSTLAVTVTDRIGFRRDDDPLVRLALVATFVGVAYLALLPGYNAYVRALETRADRFAVGLTGDRPAAIRSFVRFVDDDIQPLCPPRAVRLYLYDHEAYGTRIAEFQGRPSPCR